MVWKWRNFLMSSKSPLFVFFGFSALKYHCFKILIFRLELDFLHRYPPIIFFNTIRTSDVISVVNCVLLWRKWRFENTVLNPNHDVISKVNCVLLRRRPIFGKNRFHMAQHPISQLLMRFPSAKAPLGVLTLF